LRAGDSFFVFDSSEIRRLGSIARIRTEAEINLQGIAVVLDLQERLQDLEWENASLRARL
jgi:hypothetical protein